MAIVNPNVVCFGNKAKWNVGKQHGALESTFGEPDSTRLLTFPLAGIALLDEKCRTCESDLFALANEQIGNLFALANEQIGNLFALANELTGKFLRPARVSLTSAAP
jgi:hypothetical protein